MTPALVIKVEAASAIVLFHWSWRNEVATGHSSWTTTFEEKGGRAEADSNRHPFAYQPDALPLGQSGWLKEDDGIVQCCNWIDLHPHPHPTPAPQSPANVHPQLLNTLDSLQRVWWLLYPTVYLLGHSSWIWNVQYSTFTAVFKSRCQTLSESVRATWVSHSTFIFCSKLTESDTGTMGWFDTCREGCDPSPVPVCYVTWVQSLYAMWPESSPCRLCDLSPVPVGYVIWVQSLCAVWSESSPCRLWSESSPCRLCDLSPVPVCYVIWVQSLCAMWSESSSCLLCDLSPVHVQHTVGGGGGGGSDANKVRGTGSWGNI